MSSPFDVEPALCLECSDAPALESGFCADCQAELGVDDEQDDLAAPDDSPEDEPVVHAATEDDDVSSDLDDYCDECASLLEDNGVCSNFECTTHGCLQCGSLEECDCPPLSPKARMDLRHKRERERHATKVNDLLMSRLFPEEQEPQAFKDPDEFARYLARRRDRVRFDDERERTHDPPETEAQRAATRRRELETARLRAVPSDEPLTEERRKMREHIRALGPLCRVCRKHHGSAPCGELPSRL